MTDTGATGRTLQLLKGMCDQHPKQGSSRLKDRRLQVPQDLSSTSAP